MMRTTFGQRFQSTRPRGARPGSRPAARESPCFNPRAHVGRDCLYERYRRRFSVSIHAPTWGATQYYEAYPEEEEVSIHAPTWGATRRDTPPSCCPRVSIHAPTWGATSGCNFCLNAARVFQSTRPRGARLKALIKTETDARFNPRAHVGRDEAAKNQELWQKVSIHAPTWGATRWPHQAVHQPGFQSTRPRGARHDRPCPAALAVLVSIHAPTWGATFAATRQFRAIGVSIHAPTWGATVISGSILLNPLFQSTRPRGARRDYLIGEEHDIQFQSTRPRGARPWQGARVRCPRCFNPRAHVGRDPCRYGCRKPCWRFQSTRPRGARPHWALGSMVAT